MDKSPHYIPTRGQGEEYAFHDVLKLGMAKDGGLFIPDHFPTMPKDFWISLKGQSYQQVAFAVLKLFIGGAINDTDLKEIIRRSYDQDIFHHHDVTPLRSFDNNLHILELFHGPTLAFKDVALQFLGHLYNHTLASDDRALTVVGATSGDTGSAAIEGLKNCKGVRIFILHPYERTSDVQRRQMTTVSGDNIHNLAIQGSFDDCQSIVKDLFAEHQFAIQNHLTAVNSINWARIMAQTVYYVYAALQLGAPERCVRFAVPTGNFGNIYAAYVVRKMGLPIDRLIIGSNRNDILTRFFETGSMHLNAVELSLSPSMDIQVSSNFERFLYDLLNRDSNALKNFMTDFRLHGTARIENDDLAKAKDIFAAYRCNDEETLATIKSIHQDYDYICDPHTAVGVSAALQHGLDDNIPTIAMACAHPAKFPDAVKKAVGTCPPLPDFLSDLHEREERFTVLPPSVKDVKNYILKQSSD